MYQEVAPGLLLKPVAQFEQLEAALVVEKVPALHRLQTLLTLSWEYPGGH